MRLWIIGKKGMLAKAFQRKCLEKGVDYIATSRKEVNIEHEETLRAQFETLDFTHIINCSGFTAVDLAEEEKEHAYALNTLAVERLAKLAQETQKKIIHFSTDYVFDGKQEQYGEEALPRPLSVYGKSKEAGEKKLFEQCPKACLLRTSWLFGVEGEHFVKKMVQLLEKKECVKVVNDQRGCPTYADDLVEAVLEILNESGIYHFSNTGALSWYEWAEVIKQKLEEKNVPLLCRKIEAVSTDAYGAAASRPRSSILKVSKFKAPHWEAGLEKVLERVITPS